MSNHLKKDLVNNQRVNERKHEKESKNWRQNGKQ